MWEEVQAAAEVVRRGTVSAAASALGVHRATIHRRIDSLEAYVGSKLFQRHKHGYTPTELGQDLVQIAETAGEQLERLRRRALSQEEALQGELIVTSIDGLAPVILRKVADFVALHPAVNVTFRASHSLLRLELGEAHVAFRVGARPEEPDYVVLPNGPLRLGLYASQAYVARYGRPDADNLAAHRFVLPKGVPSASRLEHWFRQLINDPHFALAGDKGGVAETAIKAGVGAGFLPTDLAESDPTLVEVMPPDPAWQAPTWIVTHVDLHRSPKVQAFLKHFRDVTGQDRTTPGLFDRSALRDA